MYSIEGEFLNIKVEPNKDIKIYFINRRAIKEVSNIIEEAKIYKFPDFWEDTVELLTSDEKVMIKNLAQGTKEWDRLQANFMQTMPQA
jgi:hypothetical protein